MATTKIEPDQAADGLPRVLGVRKGKDERFEGGCSCGFSTRGWAKKGLAEDRLEQHAAEHRGEAETPELIEFLADHGLAVGAEPLQAFADEAE